MNNADLVIFNWVVETKWKKKRHIINNCSSIKMVDEFKVYDFGGK